MVETQGKTRPSARNGRRRSEVLVKEFEERVVEINRVTRVVKGGKRLRFRALVVIGDKASHRVAYGIGKASDVTAAVTKAVADAKKDVRQVFLQEGTLPYRVSYSQKSAHVLIKPAPRGTGLIAGGPVRIVLQLAGVQDAVAKILGSSNKISNVAAAIGALSSLQPPSDIFKQRGVVQPQSRPTKKGDK